MRRDILRERRSSSSGPRGRTRDQLYEEAKSYNIPGRSRMTKAQLARAVHRRTRRKSR